MHKRLMPPTDYRSKIEIESAAWRTEYDVYHTLISLGHQIEIIGLEDDLGPLLTAIQKQKPDLIFNLLEEFHADPQSEGYIVGLLELLKIPYTGCNPHGLMLAKDKSAAKKIVAHHQIETPRFFIISKEKKKIVVPASISFPLIIKFLEEEGSYGISLKNIVLNSAQLEKRFFEMKKKWSGDFIIEEYIEGREVYVSIMGGKRPILFPPQEMVFKNWPDSSPKIASEKVKWSAKYRAGRGVETQQMTASDPRLLQELERVSILIYRVLRLSGYARLDFRINDEGKIYFIEANPNPQICKEEDFARSAENAGFAYEKLMSQIIEVSQEQFY